MSLEKPALPPNEATPPEKELAWGKKLAHVDTIADRLGKGVEQDIKETVAIFLIYDFSTSQSCEGHITEIGKEQRQAFYPWVDFDVSDSKKTGGLSDEEKIKLLEDCEPKNLRQQQKLMSLLEEFYRDRITPFDTRLTFSGNGAFGGFRLLSFGARIMDLLSHEEKLQKLKLYQKEMHDFTEFLKAKYFSQE